MGCRHNLHLDGRRLAVPGGRARPVFQAGDWLGNRRAHGSNAGVRCPHHGVVEPQDANGRDRPFRPGQPILFRHLPETVKQVPVGLQHGQKGRLLFMPCGYDNAAMESWNHSFKVEAVHGGRFKSRAEAKYQVFEYIEVYYLCPLGTIANGFIQN